MAMPAVAAKLRAARARLRATVVKAGSWVQTHRRKTAAFFRGLPPWLWDSRYFWLTVLGAFIVPVVVLVWWPQENCIRYTGLVLQLAGIGTVWLGIRETRKLFKHPTFWQQARAWFSRRPRYGGRVIAVGALMAASASVAGRMSVSTSPRPDATLEERMAVLERNLAYVRDDLTRFQNKTEEDIRRQEQAIKQEQQERSKDVQELNEKLKGAETGGLHISAMGALWLLAGVIMGTIPDDLARWFG